MNGSKQEVRHFLQSLNDKIPSSSDFIAGLALPFTVLETGVAHAKNIKIGAQNVNQALNGAFTGEISIPMLEEVGVDYVLIGHSERRQYYNETDVSINHKIKSLVATNITPIVCVGESLNVKEQGKTIDFVNQQITKDYEGVAAKDVLKTVIAYEPIWAIGTGKTATAHDAEVVCREIRHHIRTLYNAKVADQITILYGGSVNPKNIKELMHQPNIDGVLVGGASLNANDYLALVNYEH